MNSANTYSFNKYFTIPDLSKKLLVNVEGPKGSGKSTLIKLLQARLGNQFKSHHYHHNDYLSSENLDDKLGSLPDDVRLVDRGLLSTFVYGFVNDYIPNVENNKLSFEPATLSSFARLFDDIGVMIVLYSSNDRLLFDRLDKRTNESGKGATIKELSILSASNALFAGMGLTLSKMFTNVYVVDISVTEDLGEIADELASVIKANSGRSELRHG